MTAIRQFEATYATIRHRLMTGYWRPGFHLVTPRLADDLEVSMSPVRDSLCYLAGQRMVDFRFGAGFFVQQINEEQLRNLLDLNRLLLHAATVGGDIAELPEDTSGDYVQRLAALFAHIAIGSRNAALAQAVSNLSDRLHVFRRLDPVVFPNCSDELDALQNALVRAGSISVVRDWLSHHHTARKRQAHRYVQSIADGSSP